ncbi:MAG TPA: hypothetical protein VIH48_01525 [Candidatus Bathyarchaeia archaeon]
MPRKAFDKLLLEAVDDALSSLGDSVKQAIYFHLEGKFKITKNEIPNRLEDFDDGIEKIFGLGAKFLEILIMRKLYERLGQPLDWNENKDFSFVGYVVAARECSFGKKKKTAASKA